MVVEISPAADNMKKKMTAEAASERSVGAPPNSSVPDEELIRNLVCGMLSQDPCQLRATVTRYYAPGAVLYHYLTRAATALDMYRIYRAYTFGFRSRPVIRDIIIDTQLRNPYYLSKQHHRHEIGGAVGVMTGPGVAAAGGGAVAAAPPEGCTAAAVWLDQHVVPKGWPLPLPEAVIPTIVLLKFRPCPQTGRPLVYEQYDHISLYSFIWSFGAPSLWLFERLLAPAFMYGISTVACGLDFMEEAWRFIRQQVLNEPPPESGAGAAVGGGGSSGAACGDPKFVGGSALFGGWRLGARMPAKEMPGEINHAATGYGLAGQQLDRPDLTSRQPQQRAAIQRAMEGTPAPSGAVAPAKDLSKPL